MSSFEERFNSMKEEGSGRPSQQPSSFEDRFKAFSQQPQVAEEMPEGFGYPEYVGEHSIDRPPKKYELPMGFSSGASVGLSELIPGFEKPEEDNVAFSFGQAVGSTVPIAAAENFFIRPVVEFAKKSPILARQLGALASITGWGVTGAATKGAEDIFTGKELSVDNMIEHGTTWALLDAALKGLGVPAKYVYTKIRGLVGNAAKAANTTEVKVLNDLMSNLEESGVDLSDAEKTYKTAVSILKNPQEFKPSGKLNKATPEFFNVIPESPTTKLPEEMSPSALIEGLEKGADENLVTSFIENTKVPAQPLIETELEAFSPRAETENQLGINIQEDIQRQFEGAQQEYTPLYEEVQKAAETIQHSPRRSINVALELVKELNSLKTRPEGYQKVINSVNDSLHDMGYRVIEGEGKIRLTDLNGNEVPTSGRGSFSKVPLSKTMELGRRFNKIIDYDIIGASVKSKLKPLVREVKNDIRRALPPRLQVDFNKAEEMYGRTAERFSNDRMFKIRGEERPEQIATLLSSPTDLKHLRDTLSPQQYRQVEREVLSQLESSTYDKAKSSLREVTSLLSEDAKRMAQEILHRKTLSAIQEAGTGKAIKIYKARSGELTALPRQRASNMIQNKIISDMNEANYAQAAKMYGTYKNNLSERGNEIAKKLLNNKNPINPYSNQAQQSRLSEAISKDLAESLAEGKRPKKTLTLWKTKQGRKAIDSSLKSNPAKEKVVDYLKKQTLQDTINGFVKENGSFDLPKWNQKMKDKQFLQDIYDVAGEDGLNFAKSVDMYAHRMNRNLGLMERFGEVEGPKVNFTKFKKPESSERGIDILKRMVEKDYPLKTKIDQVLESLGIPLKTVLAFLLPHNLGVLKGVASLLGGKYLYSLITKPGARKAFVKASYPYKNIGPFIGALDQLNGELEED